jgi:CreA protein
VSEFLGLIISANAANADDLPCVSTPLFGSSHQQPKGAPMRSETLSSRRFSLAALLAVPLDLDHRAGKNDRVCVSAFDDPKVPGVACHVSQARTGGQAKQASTGR